MAQFRYAQEVPGVGVAGLLFRRLSRSVRRDATGSEGVGVRCWSTQMACVRVHVCYDRVG